MFGEVTEVFQFDDLPHRGEAMLALMSEARVLAEASGWIGPRVTIAWARDVGLYEVRREGEYPVLVIDCPDAVELDVESMAENGWQMKTVQHLGWVPSLSCISLRDNEHTLELSAADVYPLFRLSNQAFLMFAFVARGTVTIVEYQFDDVDLLEVSAGLLQECRAQAGAGLARRPNSRKPSNYAEIDGRRHLQAPVVLPKLDDRY